MLPVLHHSSPLMDIDGSGERCPPNLMLSKLGTFEGVKCKVSQIRVWYREELFSGRSLAAAAAAAKAMSPASLAFKIFQFLDWTSHFPVKHSSALPRALGTPGQTKPIWDRFQFLLLLPPGSRRSGMKLQGHHCGINFVGAPCQRFSSYEIAWIPRPVVLRNIWLLCLKSLTVPAWLARLPQAGQAGFDSEAVQVLSRM